jgi:hypothetical protein
MLLPDSHLDRARVDKNYRLHSFSQGFVYPNTSEGFIFIHEIYSLVNTFCWSSWCCWSLRRLEANSIFPNTGEHPVKTAAKAAIAIIR